MLHNKKYILWFFLIGMMCLQVEQTQANVFYDDEGQFTLEGRAFLGAAAIAVIAASYKGYRFLYSEKNLTTETKIVERKNKKFDAQSLICMILALEVMAITAIDGCAEHFIRRPMRKKKIADILAEQELLKHETELEWKSRKSIESGDILSEQQAIELVYIKLRDIQRADSVKIPLIARITIGFSYEKLVDFINEAVLLAIKNDDGVLDMSHINMIKANFDTGPQYEKFHCQYETACHEAGHAVVVVDKLSNLFALDSVTIVPRKNNLSYKKDNVAGFASFTPLSNYRFNKTTEDDVKNVIMMYFAGGVAEQVSELPAPLKKEDQTQGSLSDFESRFGVQSDLKEARKFAMLLAEMRCSSWNKNKCQEEYLLEGYKKTFAYITSKKSEVEKVAQLLMEESTIPGKEVYRVLGKPEPLYDFERDEHKRKKLEFFTSVAQRS